MGLNAYYNADQYNSIKNLYNRAETARQEFNAGYGSDQIDMSPKMFQANRTFNSITPTVNSLTNAFSTQYVPSNVWQGYGIVGNSPAGEGVRQTGGMVGGAVGGTYGALISGASGMAGNLIDMFGYNPEVTPIEESMYNQSELPTYNLAEERDTTQNLMDNAMKSARRKMWSNVGKGALTGAAAGTLAEPGIGTAIGAVGGALVGLGTGLWGKESVKHQAERARGEMETQYGLGIQRLNNATENYYDRSEAQDRYNAIRKQQGGLFNLPSYAPYFGL